MTNTQTPAASASVKQTNRIAHIVQRKDGGIFRHDGGVIDPSQVPANGDGIHIQGIGCEVLGHVYTPHRGDTWTVLSVEH